MVVPLEVTLLKKFNLKPLPNKSISSLSCKLKVKIVSIGFKPIVVINGNEICKLASSLLILMLVSAALPTVNLICFV